MSRSSATSRRRAVAVGAVSGVLAGGLTLGVAELVAAAVDPAASPVLAVGDAFVDLTPPALKDFAIATFGANDKLVLLLGIGVVVTILAAAGGVLARRSLRAGQALVVVLGLVALVAAVTRPTAGLLAALPSVLGTAAGVAALTLLTRRGDALVPASSDGEPARRSFLAAAGATGVAAAVAAGGGQVVGRRARSVAGERAGLALPPPVDEMAPVPAGVDPAVEGLTPYRTPNETFYRVDTALSVPNVPASSWSLRVHGLVEREVEIDFAELLDAGLVERMVTLTCVSNEVGGELAGNAVWLGLPVRELLRRAGPLPDADMVLSTSADGFTASTPLDTLTDDRDALLAVAMNGEPLPPEHGYPVRMVVPGLYGYVSATKWVVDLEVTRFDRVTAYWTDRGWSARGPVKTASRIDVPAGFARVRGRVPVAGVAWAQGRGIDAVEVQVDDGPWRAARLAPVVSADTWRQWVWEWDTAGVPAGNHRLTVRATDSTGETQTSERVPPIPDGATGWHSVSVRVE